jgi:SNF2 family DNA or RNA helicase
MVEQGLSTQNIGFIRIDGSVAIRNRAYTIERFRNDPNVRVILLTVSCGACG